MNRAISSKWLLTGFLLFSALLQGHSQLNESEIKAAYLLNFLDNLSYENQSEMDSIRVVILGNEQLLNDFKRISGGKTIKNTPIACSANKTHSTQLVYVPYLSPNKFKDIALDYQLSAIVGEIEHYMTDIQFIKNEDGSIGFLLSVNNLKKKNIIASSELLVYNKDKTDVISLIESQESELNQLIEQSEELTDELAIKESEVNQLNQDIKQKEERLTELNSANLKKSEQLQKMQSKIINRESELTALNKELIAQDQELAAIKEELTVNYKAIGLIHDSLAHLQVLMDEKKELINQNESLLAKQQKELLHQEGKIEASDRKASRNFLLLMIAGAFTLILIFVLIILNRENKAKKEALQTIEKQNKSIQEASRQKDDFISNLSHEVRSPLNAIIGYSDLIKNSIKNPETKKNLEYITMSSKNLLGVINDILDYRRIEAGKGKLEDSDFELKPLILVLFNTLKITAENKGLEYVLDYDSTLPDYVRSDSKKISQILLNLISNAIKFTTNGSVTVLVKKVQEDRDFCKVLFEVKDTGIGIEKTKQQLIFDRFTQESDETIREFGGSGLGLSISKKLIELLGSSINVESEPGKGASFSFELDLKRGEQIQTPDEAEQETVVKSLSEYQLLIADDLELNRTLLQKQFESKGCKDNLMFANNGLEALELISKNKVDILLTDVQMPLMNGLELSKVLRKKGLKLPIIGISANNDQKEEQRCLDAGMDCFLIKPYLFNDLLSIIGRLIGHNITSSSSEDSSRKNEGIYFTFERLKEITESEEEFETTKEELVTSVKENVSLLKGNLDVKLAHEVVNKSAYLGNDDFLELCRNLETHIRKEKLEDANKILSNIDLIITKHLDV